MKIRKLRNKLLLSAASVSIVVVLVALLTVSFVIRKQHLDQSNALLQKAISVIGDNLSRDKSNLLAVSRQLATQKNLGATILYLEQYAQSDIDRETLSNTYQQLAKDTYKIGRVANLSRIVIYDSAGKLVAFSLFGKSGDQVGFVERPHAPVFQAATLKEGEELNQNNLRAINSVAYASLQFDGQLPHQESVHYAVSDGMLTIESHVPIMGEYYDLTIGKPKIKQLGFVVAAHKIDQSFVDQLSKLTDTSINVFTRQGFSVGNLTTYRTLDWNGAAPDATASVKTESEIAIGGKGYYQSLMPLYTDKNLVGTIVALYSKDLVQKNIREMVETLGAIAACSLLIIFSLAWYFATSIAQPLTILSRVFRGVASGEHASSLYSEFIHLEEAKARQDELGDLTRSFIGMNEAVNQKIQQINELNASLEKKVEERTIALAASEQESRTLIENSPDTVARYDRECRRIYANPALVALGQGGVAAMQDKRPSEFPGGAQFMMHETKIREVFTTGKECQFELEWPSMDGIERYFHIRLIAEYDLSGTVTSVLGIGRDISARKAAEKDQNRLARALQLMSKCDSVLVRAEKEQVLLTEICRLTVESGGYLMAWVGFAENDSIKTVRPVAQSGHTQGYLDYANITWADTEHGQGPIGRAIRENVTVSVQDIQSNRTMTIWREAALKRGYKSAIALPVVINKQVLGVLVIYSSEPFAFAQEEVALLEELASDLSYGINALRTRAEHDAAERALKESMRQLESKELAKTRFLAAAGHDLRQPLAAANLFIDALKFSDPTAEQNKIIQRLDQAMTNFNGLLDALLNVSKLDAGIIKPEFTPIPVGIIFNWLEESFAALATEKHIRFKLYFPMNKSLVVRSDFGLLKSVLMNLVSNAIKYTLKGSILVSARRRGDYLLFQIWDTGIGIANEQIGKIFDEFYQVDNAQRDRTKGIGLGLPIAKRALSLLEGEITCRSQVGRGSVFEFLQPLDINIYSDDTQGTIHAESVLENCRSFVQGKRFVVIEDDTMLSEALSKSLEIMGGEVVCFENAECALAHPDIGKVDCYIADYMLPGDIDGINFLLRLRQQLHRPVCAVMMSGNTSSYFIRKAELFDWPVLHKPVNISKLISQLSEQHLKIV